MLFCETFCCHLVCYKNMHTHTYTQSQHTRSRCSKLRCCFVPWMGHKKLQHHQGLFFLFLCLFSLSAQCLLQWKSFSMHFLPPRFPFLSLPRIAQLYGKYLSALRVFALFVWQIRKVALMTQRHDEVQHLCNVARKRTCLCSRPRNIKF